MMDDAGIPALQDAIKKLHGCDSRWIESVPVREMFRGEVAWEGDVETFELIGHPKAKRAYAWSYVKDNGKRQFMAVLGVPPIDSAVMAVRAAIVAGSPVN